MIGHIKLDKPDVNWKHLLKSKVFFKEKDDVQEENVIHPIPMVIIMNPAQTKILKIKSDDVSKLYIGNHISDKKGKKMFSNKSLFISSMKNEVKNSLGIDIKISIDNILLIRIENEIGICYTSKVDFRNVKLDSEKHEVIKIDDVSETKNWDIWSQKIIDELFTLPSDLFDEDRLFDMLNEAREVKRTKTGKIRSTLAYGSLTHRIRKWKDEHGDDADLAFKMFRRKYIRGKTGKTINTLNQLQSGKIFTFDYKEPLTVKKGDYYDEKPVILYVKHWYSKQTRNRLIMGLNLNFLEQYVRQDLLKTVYYRWRELYQSDGSTENKVLFSGDRFLDILKQMLTRRDYNKYVEPAIRQYIWKRMKNIKRVNYGDWILVSIMDTETIVPFGGELEDESAK